MLSVHIIRMIGYLSNSWLSLFDFKTKT